MDAFRVSIWDWLEAKLQKGTLRRYTLARNSFEKWGLHLGIKTQSLEGDDLDVTLARFILDTKEDEDAPLTKQGCIDCVAAVQRRKGRTFRLANLVLKAWNKEQPPKQAEAMPAMIAYAMVTVMAVVLNEPIAALHTLLAFTGCLRIGESLGLKFDDVVLPRPFQGEHRLILILNQTKTSFDQRVVITNALVIKAVLEFLLYFARGKKKSDPVAPITYSRYARIFRTAVDVLGLPGSAWRTHSLRRGAATSLIDRGMPFEDVRLYGRWSSDSSAREYIRLGQMAMLRVTKNIPEKQWKKYVALAGGVDRSFSLAAKGRTG